MKTYAIPRPRLSAQPSRFHKELRAWSPSKVRCEAKPELAQMMIFGPIGTPDEFWMPNAVDDNAVAVALSLMHGVQEFDLLINSPGGDAWTGVSIFNLLKNASQKINVRITGAAFSAASVIAMAGDTIKMETGSTMMIHRAWSCLCGNSLEMHQFADVLDVADQGIAAIYAERTGKPVEDLLAMMHPDHYMTAAEAVEQGFADGAQARRGDDDEDDEDDDDLYDAGSLRAFLGGKPAVNASPLQPSFFWPKV